MPTTMPCIATPVHGMNPWEDKALRYEFPEAPTPVSDDEDSSPTWRPLQDPIIYPGVYSSSGLDVMSILFRIVSRPNPQIALGPVDASVAMTICDLDDPSCPIIYASDAFCDLTGFSRADILGKHPLYFQSPLTKQYLHAAQISERDLAAMQIMRDVMRSRAECQIEAATYKKCGQSFSNMISIISITMPDSGANYAVCFNVEHQ